MIGCCTRNWYPPRIFDPSGALLHLNATPQPQTPFPALAVTKRNYRDSTGRLLYLSLGGSWRLALQLTFAPVTDKSTLINGNLHDSDSWAVPTAWINGAQLDGLHSFTLCCCEERSNQDRSTDSIRSWLTHFNYFHWRGIVSLTLTKLNSYSLTFVYLIWVAKVWSSAD